MCIPSLSLMAFGLLPPTDCIRSITTPYISPAFGSSPSRLFIAELYKQSPLLCLIQHNVHSVWVDYEPKLWYDLDQNDAPLLELVYGQDRIRACDTHFTGSSKTKLEHISIAYDVHNRYTHCLALDDGRDPYITNKPSFSCSCTYQETLRILVCVGTATRSRRYVCIQRILARRRR
jgi:hypothetical protein